ncbi:MAG: polymerase alpha subunit [Labilithrix sp.]|nr:polymerase alpha subunit [Labilithrix sp.]
MTPRIRIDPSTRMPFEGDAASDVTKELAALRRTIESRASRYVELSARTSFSFLSGATPPEYMVFRAAELGYDAIAITDRDGLYGIVRACEEAAKHNVRVIVGCELTLEQEGLEGVPEVPGKPSTLTVLVEDHAGYTNLCKILTESHARHPKSIPNRRADNLDEEDLPRNTFAGVPLRFICAHSEGLWALADAALLTESAGAALVRAFGPRLSIAAHLHKDGEDRVRVARSLAAARTFGVPICATNRVLYARPEDKPVLDVLHCIREGKTLDEAGRDLVPNAEAHLKNEEEITRLFSLHPEWVARSRFIAERCRFSIKELAYRFPYEITDLVHRDFRRPSAPGEEAAPNENEETAQDALRRLTYEGAHARYGESIPEKVATQIEKELALIDKLEVAPYFLSVRAVVDMARRRDILCQGRGSAANSAVCFCLGITAVDPARSNMLFERFLSAERREPPDIDVDFEHERREEVIQEIYKTYGRDRAAMVCEVVSYRSKSALREVGKVFGFSLEQVDRLAGVVSWWDGMGAVSESRLRAIGFSADDPRVRQTLVMSKAIQGFPRHLSIHVGGFVLSAAPLTEVAPIEPATMDARTIIPWDKDDIDTLGFFKIDVLGLGMLTAIRKCLDLVRSVARGQGVEGSRDQGRELGVRGRGVEGSRDQGREQRERENREGEDAYTSRPLGPWPLGPLAPESASGPLAPESASGPSAPRPLGPSAPQARPLGPSAPDTPPRLEAPARGSVLRSPAEKSPAPETVPAVSSAGPKPGATSRSLQASRTTEYALAQLVQGTAIERLARIPAEEPKVYDALCNADTVGVFQIESRAQMAMLPRLRPRTFYDLVIEVAIVRPGPIQGGMVHPYLRRRTGEESHAPPHPLLQPILERTLGVPLFQEQVMQIAIVGAGYTGGEADRLRRDMAAWRKTGSLEKHRGRLLEGFRERGIPEEFGERLYQQIHGFAEYGFPESHSASFALLVYASAWLKVFYPAEFAAALINSQPMGFYSPSTLLQDAQRHGVELLPIDVNVSGWDCTCVRRDAGKGTAIRLGLRLVSGLGEDAGRRIEQARAERPFANVDDVVARAHLDKKESMALAESGALDVLAAGPDGSRHGPLRRHEREHPCAEARPDDALRAARPRLRAYGRFDHRPSDEAPSIVAIEALQVVARRGGATLRNARERCGPRHMPPAAGDGERRGLHHDGGRARVLEPRGLVEGVRTVPSHRDVRAHARRPRSHRAERRSERSSSGRSQRAPERRLRHRGSPRAARREAPAARQCEPRLPLTGQ